MSLLSRITDWSRRSADILLVAETSSVLVDQIRARLDSIEINYALASSYIKTKRPCAHFFSADSFLRTPVKKLATTDQLIVNVMYDDLVSATKKEHLIDRLGTICLLYTSDAADE